jgi:hypothetical protein
MAIYPVEFYRRAEEKWKLRYASPRAPHPTLIAPEQPVPEKNGGDDVFTQWPWLIAIGQGLVSQYVVGSQPLPKRLLALLKKLAARGL